MPFQGYSPEVIKDWLIGGIDFNLAGNGGPSCTDFSPPARRCLDVAFGIMFASVLIMCTFKNCSIPEYEPAPVNDKKERKAFLAIIVSLVFGMEVAYKFSTRSVIFLLNPCHMITAVQIYLLAATPSRLVTAVFRIHLNFLNGGVLALIFPVTNTLFLPFETETYYIQHFLILITPYYLLREGGAYNVEKLSDFSWTYMGYAVMLLYHFVVLIPIAVPLQVNLSQLLCPAISDPFYGLNYRIYGIIHQAIFVPFLYKIYCAISQYFIKKFP